MKSQKLLQSALMLGALAGCAGESLIGKGNEAGAGGGDGDGDASSMGARAGRGAGGRSSAGAASSMGAMSSGGGMSTPRAGSGGSSSVEMCMSDSDCPGFDAPCQMCESGGTSCNKTYCLGSRCVTDMVSPCPTKCSDSDDCIGGGGMGCIDCGDGTQTCPTGECVDGFCSINMLGCQNMDPCQGLGCGAQCKQCADSSCDVMVVNYCSKDGKCQAGTPECSSGGMCNTTMDCGSPPPNCVECGDGSCAGFECIENKCVFACPANPNPECKVSEDCPVTGEMCKMCTSGKCAVQACLQGSCELVCPFE